VSPLRYLKREAGIREPCGFVPAHGKTRQSDIYDDICSKKTAKMPIFWSKIIFGDFVHM
jgi:hypothetical protein